MNLLAAIIILALPISPGLQGFGTDTVAGSGRNTTPPKTTIYRVTSLADSGPGSLRECAEANVPRTCIFETSGYIALKARLDIKSPYLTIAGQTAPGGGVQLRGAGLKLSASDILIQHIGIRIGDDPTGPNPDTRDGIVVWRDATDISNVVLDHVSITWALDEACSTYASKGEIKNVTFSNSLFAESLKFSIHSEDYETKPAATATPRPDAPTPRPTATLRPWVTPSVIKPTATPQPDVRKGHSMGCLVDHHSHNFTFTQNLFAHLNDRNIRTKEDVSIQFINNVVYNWGGVSSWNGFNMASASPAASPANLIDFIGNYYKAGPQTPIGREGENGPFPVIHWKTSETPPLTSKVYVQGNIGPLRPTDSGDEWKGISELPDSMRSLVRMLPGEQAPLRDVGTLLNQVGARPWDRYSSDSRIVSETEKGGGVHKDCVGACPPNAGKLRDGIGISAEPGGWPEVKGVTIKHSLPANPNDLQSSGYTALEEWIHAFSHALPDATPSALPTATLTPTPTQTPDPTATAVPTEKAKTWRCNQCVEG
jgi:hypothetical protein